MFGRALIAFLALPGMVAFIIPATWLWQTGHTQVAQPFGLLSLASGVLGLLWCVRDPCFRQRNPRSVGAAQDAGGCRAVSL